MACEEDVLTALLRKTFATLEQGEIAFIHMPKERLDKKIFAMRFGTTDLEEHGVTYSLTKQKLYICFPKTETGVEVTRLGKWTLIIPPCAERAMTSIAVPSSLNHTLRDEITALYLPDHADTTRGMTVIHFTDDDEAEAFKQHLETPLA